MNRCRCRAPSGFHFRGTSLLRLAAPVGSLFFAVAMLASCKGPDTTAGTSSEVDNPALTLVFTQGDSVTTASGRLEVYLPGYNPLTKKPPLRSLEFAGSTAIVLEADTLRRILDETGASATHAAVVAKAGASGGGGRWVQDGGDHPGINLLILTADNRGGTVSSLRWDPVQGRWAGRDFDSALDSLRVALQPLVRYGASLTEGEDGEWAWAYLPGFPYRSTVEKGSIVFPDLAPGRFELRAQSRQGRTWEADSHLESGRIDVEFRAGVLLTQQPQPVDLPQRFEITAFGPEFWFLEEPLGLEGIVHSQFDRIPEFVLWRQIEGPLDTEIEFPRSLRPIVQFQDTGQYAFVLEVTIEGSTRADTLYIYVEDDLEGDFGDFAILQPMPGQIIPAGTSVDVKWLAPHDGLYLLELSLDGGARWEYLGSAEGSDDVDNLFTWAVPETIAPTDVALIRVSNLTKGEFTVMDGFFSLVGP